MEDVVSNGIMRPLSNGRTANWRDGTVVICKPDAVEHFDFGEVGRRCSDGLRASLRPSVAARCRRCVIRDS
jgi:hypothetical protein